MSTSVFADLFAPMPREGPPPEVVAAARERRRQARHEAHPPLKLPGCRVEVFARVGPAGRGVVFAAMRPWLESGRGRVTIAPDRVLVEGIEPVRLDGVRATLRRVLDAEAK